MAEYIEREAALRIVNGFCHPVNIGDEIAKLPAADVRPVVRGRWVKEHTPYNDHAYRCSACNKEIGILGNPLAYCPNCGAKMEVDDD